MKPTSRLLAPIVVIMLLLASCGGSSSSTSPSTGSATASALVDIGSGIRGPSGLAATEYATGLTHAAAFAFDVQQRLWVATADYTDAGKDAVFLVTKSGAMPTRIIVALHTPLGLLWHESTLYVASKERVDAYSGFTGTAFATHRTVVTLPTNVGEVNNIGLAYYPGTSDLFVSMDYRDDLGTSTTGDALAVVREGTSWKNPECYGQGGPACTNVATATAVLDKHAAVSGVAIVTDRLGTTIGYSAIVEEWALGKVERVALTKTGSTYTGTATTLLTGIKNPVAVTLANDGSLLVGDWTTGIIYRVATTATGST